MLAGNGGGEVAKAINRRPLSEPDRRNLLPLLCSVHFGTVRTGATHPRLDEKADRLASLVCAGSFAPGHTDIPARNPQRPLTLCRGDAGGAPSPGSDCELLFIRPQYFERADPGRSEERRVG